MKLCPTCKNQYSDDANFCPREECAGPTGPQRLSAVAEEPPPRFVPISRLGGGASGEVWQASDAQSGGAVAYKVVAPEALPTVTAVDRAQRELRQLQRANNPHIVKVVDFGKTPEGALYVASELATGEPLDQVVAGSGPFPLDRAKRIAAQIGEALLEAQKVGVVHRDLSAKNVLVSADDEVRLINFAIPRPLSATLFGVPEFMSPEQSEGKLIDQRSNTYSLGALLYLMLTAKPPHLGESTQATIESIQRGEITPPSIKRGGGLTAEVDRIVLKALERNSSRRPLTMRQFLTDVSGLIVTDQTASPAGGGAKGENAFARTMMFAGGASEVQKLVAQAVAARQAAGNGAPETAPAPAAPEHSPEQAPGEDAAAGTPPPRIPPVVVSSAPATATPSPAAAATPSPVAAATPSPLASGRPTGTPPPLVPRQPAPARDPAQTPPPVPRASHSHGAAVAATMVSMPAASPITEPAGAPMAAAAGAGAGAEQVSEVAQGSGAPAANLQAPPQHAHTPPLAGAGAAAPADGGKFRETLWFKQGDVEQMVAEARAKVAAVATAQVEAAKPEPEVPAVDDGKPLEDRYVDDGTVTVEDRKKFSLRSGRTSTSLPMRGGSIPGERMSEEEILGEIGGGKRMLIIGIVAAVVVVLIAVVAIAMSGKGKGSTAETTPAAQPAGAPSATAPAGAPPTSAPPQNAAPPAPPVAPAAAAPPPAAPVRPARPAADQKAESAGRTAAAKRRAANKKKATAAKSSAKEPPAKKRR